MITWDTMIATNIDTVEGSYSLPILLNIKGKVCWWFISVYEPIMYREVFFFGGVIVFRKILQQILVLRRGFQCL